MWRKASKASRRHSLDPLAEASSEKSCGSEKSVSERSLLSGLFQPPKAQLALQQALQRAQQAQQAQKRAASATSTASLSAAGSSNGESAGLAAVSEGSGDDIGLLPPPPPPPPPPRLPPPPLLLLLLLLPMLLPLLLLVQLTLVCSNLGPGGREHAWQQPVPLRRLPQAARRDPPPLAAQACLSRLPR